MTCRTLLSERFVNHYRRLILGDDREMTFFTRDFFVSAVQLKSAVTIMHKQ